MLFRLLTFCTLLTATAAGQQAALNSDDTQPRQSPPNKAPDATAPNTASLEVKDARESREHPPVKRSILSASISDEMTMTGTIHLELETEASLQKEVTPLLLGPTNLQSLALSSGEQPISVAMDHLGNLIPLSQPGSREIFGTWSAVGMPVSGSTVF